MLGGGQLNVLKNTASVYRDGEVDWVNGAHAIQTL